MEESLVRIIDWSENDAIEWAERCIEYGTVPIDVEYNSETKKYFLKCYKYLSPEFDLDITTLGEQVAMFRAVLFEQMGAMQ